jgi:iron(II)-dependent oxidoreductase
MLHQLPLEQKVRQLDPPGFATAPVVHRMVEVPAGAVALGLPRGGEDFGWDNEYDAHSVDVPAFCVDQYKVTNREYREFVTAGGYETRSLWNDEDWDWKTTRGISHPVFWKRSGDGWLYRTMFDEVPLPLDWPVYVSHAEAMAYARWVGKSLPTEAEWQRAACDTSEEGTGPSKAETRQSGFESSGFASWNPKPVNALPEDQSAFGVRSMFGQGWEWTSSFFNPFPGFEPFPFYRGYSADFFDGKHFVMKGGSPLTAACMLRPTFRNWFQPHYQYVYAGFRCVSR